MGHVFLSFSEQDERVASQIRDKLVQDGLDVWWDSVNAWGDNWAYNLGQALEGSDCMIVLVSPASMNSDLVRREIVHAITHESFRDRVFLAIVKRTSNIPDFLRSLHAIDLTKDFAAGSQSLVKAIRTAIETPARSIIRTESAKRSAGATKTRRKTIAK